MDLGQVLYIEVSTNQAIRYIDPKTVGMSIKRHPREGAQFFVTANFVIERRQVFPRACKRHLDFAKRATSKPTC